MFLCALLLEIISILQINRNCIVRHRIKSNMVRPLKLRMLRYLSTYRLMYYHRSTQTNLIH